MRVLVLGRFQPLHLGHVRMMEYAASKSDYLVIGIGSSNRPISRENPFTVEERVRMVRESLGIPTPYDIISIPDFGDDGAWVRWIKDNIAFDAYMTNSKNERMIFEGAGLRVLDVPFYNRPIYWATEVRRRIVAYGDWESLLPEGTVSVVREVGGADRIRKLAAR